MTIRRWSGTLLGLIFIGAYVSIYNFINPTGKVLWFMLGLGVLILIFAIYNSYKSSDAEQIKRRVKKHKESRDDVFDEGKYELLKETSKEVFNIEGWWENDTVSRIVRETFGKEEWDEVQKLLVDWKNENNFTWDEKTLYDELVVEAEYDNGLVYSIKHVKNTKTFKIKGKLEKVTYKGKEKETLICKINGVEISLLNVKESNIGEVAEWEISAEEGKNDKFKGIIVKRNLM